MTQVTKPILLDETGQQMVGKMEGIIQALQAHGTTDHSQLDNLDYEHSGHTGFQPTISDLSTIRSGAQAGATAYQKPSTGIPASDLASGVIPTVPTALSQLSQDSSHRVVTDTEKSTWNAKGTYSKPSGGIPKTDLTSAVQTSLGKADTALQPTPLVDNTSSSTATATLDPGKVYRYIRSAGLTSLSISLANPSDNTKENEYVIEFISGSTPTSVTLPTGFKWVNGEAPTIEANKHYRLVFLKPNNLAIWGVFATPTV